MKWNPGHYMQHRSFDQAARFSDYDAGDFASNRNIQGVSVFFRWNQLEGNTRGDYAAGIKLIQAEIRKLKSLPVPKRLIIRVMDRLYDDTPSLGEYARIYPQYMYDAGKLFTGPSTVLWKRYDAEANGWFIDMLNAYAAAFEGEPFVEMICPFQETSYDSSTAPSDFSSSKLRTQYDRLALALRTAWPTTNVWMPTNWEPYSSMGSFLSYLASIDVGAGNPDTVKSGTQLADTYLRGEVGGTDYRGVMPIVFAIEDTSMGYRSGEWNVTAQEAFQYVNGTAWANYFLWDRNTWVGTDDQRWYKAGTTQPGGILQVINSQPLTHLSKPIGYP
jgi:hypothetical protein